MMSRPESGKKDPDSNWSIANQASKSVQWGELDFEQFCIAGFPGEHSSSSQVRYVCQYASPPLPFAGFALTTMGRVWADH
jgi:hypothetical protein